MIRSILKAVIVGWVAKKFLDRRERRTADQPRRPDRSAA